MSCWVLQFFLSSPSSLSGACFQSLLGTITGCTTGRSQRRGFPAAIRAGVSAIKGKNPPLILFIHLLRMVGRLALRGMMSLTMKVKFPTRAIYALAVLCLWVCDEIFEGTVESHDRIRVV